ncbi:DUF2515 family protein [Camelliibacillus cellulosilyticus]|uniref:DUF2515 family protein n=1 Tax=Camelliibacillus cellulosilyticus TaxID=2174486 RepID=A0ABV9GKJ0_9BACL
MTQNLVKYYTKRRVKQPFSVDDHRTLQSVEKLKSINNKDNLTRTAAYLSYYKSHKNILWALLASMVSRNAGWNMTDLQHEPYLRWLSARARTTLFHTYERPNWLIFDDAYPQLLIYEQSLNMGRPLFYLLKAFGVSLFMEIEWEYYWRSGDDRRLCTALIVNEQHVIEKPVLKHPYYHHQVFDHLTFWLQERLRINAVVFPDLKGKLYGFSTVNFRQVGERILLGKRLFTVLFDKPEATRIQAFAESVPHTGSRWDYEQFRQASVKRDTETLRELFPAITHRRLTPTDWFDGHYKREWFCPPYTPPYDLTAWYRKKRRRLNMVGRLVGLEH